MASKKLSRLSKSLLEKPQLITLEKFQEISDVLDNREYLTNPKLFLDYEDDYKSSDDKQTYDYGILRIEGPTTYKPTGWEALCGGASYVSMIQQMKDFAAEGKKAVVMWLNSPGGQAYRMMSTARQIRKIADDNDMKLIGYVDGLAASAGIGLASVTHELISNPESEVGSIGVVVSLLNNSKQLEKEGIERKFITAGESKVPFEDDGSFKEGFLDDIQASVNDLYGKFVSHVASYRGVDEKVIKDTQARVFKAEKALELGLVDKLMEEEEFFEYLESILESETSDNKSVSSAEALSNKKTSKGEQMTAQVDVTELEAKIAEMQAAMEAQTTQLQSYKAKEEADTKAALYAKFSAMEFLSKDKDSLVEAFMSAELPVETKNLIESVISNAQASLDSVNKEFTTKLEEAQAKVVEAEEKALAASVEAEGVKKQFGEKQSSVEAPVKPEAHADQGAERTANLAEIVKAKKLASK